MNQAQIIEIDKYREAYKDSHYAMGPQRLKSMRENIESLEPGTLLDIGCGRGETIRMANNLGFDAQGVEVVEELIDNEKVFFGISHDLPFQDRSFDYVTMYDVMEHLLPENTEKTLMEMERVVNDTIFIAICSRSHIVNGFEMHINIHTEKHWDALLKNIMGGEVSCLGANRISTTWRIDYGY